MVEILVSVEAAYSIAIVCGKDTKSGYVPLHYHARILLVLKVKPITREVGNGQSNSFYRADSERAVYIQRIGLCRPQLE